MAEDTTQPDDTATPQQEQQPQGEIEPVRLGVAPDAPAELDASESQTMDSTRGAVRQVFEGEEDVLAPGIFLEPQVNVAVMGNVTARTGERFREGHAQAIGLTEVYEQVHAEAINDHVREAIRGALERPRHRVIEWIHGAFNNQRRQLWQLLDGTLAQKIALANVIGVTRGVNWPEFVERAAHEAREKVLHRRMNDTERLQEVVNRLRTPANNEVSQLLNQILGMNDGAFGKMRSDINAKLLARHLEELENQLAPAELVERLRAVRGSLTIQSQDRNPDLAKSMADARSSINSLPDQVAGLRKLLAELPPVRPLPAGAPGPVPASPYAQLLDDIQAVSNRMAGPQAPAANELRMLQQQQQVFERRKDAITAARSKIHEEANKARMNVLRVRGVQNLPFVPDFPYLNWICETLSGSTLTAGPNFIDTVIENPLAARALNAVRGLRQVNGGLFNHERGAEALAEFNSFANSIGTPGPISYEDCLIRLKMARYTADNPNQNDETRRKTVLTEVFVDQQLLKSSEELDAVNRARAKRTRNPGVLGWLGREFGLTALNRIASRWTTKEITLGEAFNHVRVGFEPNFRTWLSKLDVSDAGEFLGTSSMRNLTHQQMRAAAEGDPNFNHKELFKFAVRLGRVMAGLELDGQRRIEIRREDIPHVHRFIEHAKRLYAESEAAEALKGFDRPESSADKAKNQAEYLAKVLEAHNRARDEFETAISAELIDKTAEWKNWFRPAFYRERLREAKANIKAQGMTPAEARQYLRDEALFDLGSAGRKNMRKTIAYAKSAIYRGKQAAGLAAAGAVSTYKAGKWTLGKGKELGVKAIGLGKSAFELGKTGVQKGIAAGKWTLKAPFRGAWWAARAPFRAAGYIGGKAAETGLHAAGEIGAGVGKVAGTTAKVAAAPFQVAGEAVGMTANTARHIVGFPFHVMAETGRSVKRGWRRVGESVEKNRSSGGSEAAAA